MSEQANVFQEWVQQLLLVACAGEPFFMDGKFQGDFHGENESLTIAITKKPTNIIQFPKPEKK